MDEGNPVEDRGNRAGKVPEIGGIAEDDGGEDDIQKLTDKFIKEIDGYVSEKEQEVLSL